VSIRVPQESDSQIKRGKREELGKGTIYNGMTGLKESRGEGETPKV
jgi:hypothetical protein